MQDSANIEGQVFAALGEAMLNGISFTPVHFNVPGKMFACFSGMWIDF
jgi:hypothetical protein